MSTTGPRRNVFLYSPELESYSYPPENPFRTERAAMTRDILRSHGMLSGDRRSELAPPAADREVLKKFHEPRYLDAILAAENGQPGVEGLAMGLGPVLLESTDWIAGLRDRAIVPEVSQRADVTAAVNAVVTPVKQNVFALHGL